MGNTLQSFLNLPDDNSNAPDNALASFLDLPDDSTSQQKVAQTPSEILKISPDATSPSLPEEITKQEVSFSRKFFDAMLQPIEDFGKGLGKKFIGGLDKESILTSGAKDAGGALITNRDLLKVSEPVLAAIDSPFQLVREMVKSGLEESKKAPISISGEELFTLKMIFGIDGFFRSGTNGDALFKTIKKIPTRGSIFGAITAGKEIQDENTFDFLPEILEEAGIPEGGKIPDDVPVFGGLTTRGVLGFLTELVAPTKLFKMIKGTSQGEKAVLALSKIEGVNVLGKTDEMLGLAKSEVKAIEEVSNIYDKVVSKYGVDVTKRAKAIEKQLIDNEINAKSTFAKAGLKEDLSNISQPLTPSPDLPQRTILSARESAEVIEKELLLQEQVSKNSTLFEKMKKELGDIEANQKKLAEKELKLSKFKELTDKERDLITSEAVNHPIFQETLDKIKLRELQDELRLSKLNNDSIGEQRIVASIRDLKKKQQLEEEFANKFFNKSKENLDKVESKLIKLEEVIDDLSDVVNPARTPEGIRGKESLDIAGRDLKAGEKLALQTQDAFDAATNPAEKVAKELDNALGKVNRKKMTFNQSVAANKITKEGFFDADEATKIVTKEAKIEDIINSATERRSKLGNSATSNSEEAMSVINKLDDKEIIKLDDIDLPIDDIDEPIKATASNTVETLSKKKIHVADSKKGSKVTKANDAIIKKKTNRLSNLLINRGMNGTDLEDALRNKVGVLGENITEAHLDEAIDLLNKIDRSWTHSEKSFFLKHGVEPPTVDAGGMGALPSDYADRSLRSGLNSIRLKMFNFGETMLRKSGPVGEELADKLVKYQFEVASSIGKDLILLNRKSGEYIFKGLDNNEVRAVMASFTDSSSLPKLTDNLLNARDRLIGLLEKHADRAESLNFQTIGANGKKKPFMRRTNFAPRVYDFNWAKGKKRMEKVVSNYAKKLRGQDASLSLDDSIALANREIDSIKKLRRKVQLAPNLEFERLHDAPGWLGDPSDLSRTGNKYTQDVLLGLERYISKNNKRFADKQIFNDIDALIGRESNPDKRALFNIMHKRVLGIDEVGAESTVSRVLRNFQVFDKLELAVISNAFQTIITTVPKSASLGFIRQVRILKAGLADLGSDFAVKSGAVSTQTMQDIVSASEQGISGKMANFVLRRTGFSHVEKFNNVFSANVGKQYFQELIQLVSGKSKPLIFKNKKVNFARAELKKFGLDDIAVSRIIKGDVSKIGPKQLEEAGWRFARLTQFRASPLDMPLYASTEWGKTLFQFKTFSANMSKFFKDELLKPALKGNMLPIMEFAGGALMVGEAHSAIKNFMAGRDNTSVLTARNNEELFKAVMEDMFWAASFGIYSDAISNVSRGQALELIAGPTITDIANIAEGLTVLPKKMEDGEVLQYLTEKLLKRVPGSQIKPLVKSLTGSDGIKDFSDF